MTSVTLSICKICENVLLAFIQYRGDGEVISIHLSATYRELWYEWDGWHKHLWLGDQRVVDRPSARVGGSSYGLLPSRGRQFCATSRFEETKPKTISKKVACRGRHILTGKRQINFNATGSVRWKKKVSKVETKTFSTFSLRSRT
jgi:hypothetical protein